METILNTLFVPMILFMVVVAPMWIVFHFLFGQKSYRQLTRQEKSELEALDAHADNLVERIETLESILDTESPQWRRDHDSAR